MRLVASMQEDQLVISCIKNVAEAQEILYNKYLAYLLTIARRYGISASNEPDVIQEIYIEIFSSLSNYDISKGSLKTWIRTLAVYKILKIKRKKGTLLIVDISDYEEKGTEQLIDYQNHPPVYILNAIRSLSDGYQTIFNLYEVDGYSHQEIAKMLSITPEGSRSQLSRARAILRKKLVNNKYMTK